MLALEGSQTPEKYLALRKTKRMEKEIKTLK
jgi:hypothetical protein